MLLALQIIIVLGAIFLGARLGSIAIGMAGGAGVLLLGLTGVPVTIKDIPFDVIGIIMCVIAAIAAMQKAGGLDYLVYLAEKALRKNPKQITIWAPIVTWLMTVFCGTGHTAFSTLPVIAEVAKEGGVRPSRPLSIAVVASQMAITASPISAAVVFMTGIMEKDYGVGYLSMLAVFMLSTFIACIAAAFITNFLDKDLADDPVYQERLANGTCKPPSGMHSFEPAKGAKASVIIFLCAILLVMAYATAISQQVGLIKDPSIPRNEAIMAIMLGAATVIVMVCKLKADTILQTSVFRSGMSACICVLGVAWLGTTLINHYIEQIKNLSGDVLKDYPWMLAVVLFFAAALLYSQAATAKALIPAALTVGVSPLVAIASFAAVSALFILPTYPTLLAAVEMDDTGSTKIGKYVFNHSFIIPGTLAVTFAVALGFLFGSFML